jgi:hypothetical protein
MRCPASSRGWQELRRHPASFSLSIGVDNFRSKSRAPGCSRKTSAPQRSQGLSATRIPRSEPTNDNASSIRSGSSSLVGGPPAVTGGLERPTPFLALNHIPYLAEGVVDRRPNDHPSPRGRYAHHGNLSNRARHPATRNLLLDAIAHTIVVIRAPASYLALGRRLPDSVRHYAQPAPDHDDAYA